jgi:3-hydroxyisobutyrate dehydrogenase
VVLTMLRDDDVSRAVWLDPETGALAGMGRDALAIESSTLTPDWVRELSTAMADKGVALLEAPVSGSLPAAGGQLVFLLGGPEEAVARAKPCSM